MDDHTSCFVYNPLRWGTTAPAIAATRAGGAGVLVAALEDAQWVAAALGHAAAACEQPSRIGLRVEIASWSAPAVAEWTPWLRECGAGFLIVQVQAPAEEGEAPVWASPGSDRSVFWEITDARDIAAIRRAAPRIDGWIVVGEEAGGRPGTLSAPLLLQRVLDLGTTEPVWVRGIAGVVSAAAVQAAGAAGVVLDDQILLLSESPWRESAAAFLQTLNGQECLALGDAYATSYRFLNRPEFAAARQLTDYFRRLEGSPMADEDVAREWRKFAEKKIGWRADQAWPCGQGAAFAAPLAVEFVTTGRLVQAVIAAGPRWIESAARLAPLSANSPLAVAHGTQFPVVQGPMTRVSDRAEFAAAVAREGGLPVLALALMRGNDVDPLLRATAQLLGERPWAVGVLGFVPPELRREQIEAILRTRPRFAVIAGGRPDQARELEQAGITTYLHAPVPSLLATYVRAGARHFILEGRECGGHVGPLASLALWEQSVTTLLQEAPRGEEAKFQILFAGGIHDARSAALATVMAAPLAERGMRVGVLMGTAYVLTADAAQSGAVRPAFQSEILQRPQSVALETGPGHATRCAISPFTREFHERRRQLLRAGTDGETMKDDLERMGLGRLRLATKGVERDDGGSLVEATAVRQREGGMYMIGEAAALHAQLSTIHDLHTEVCGRSTCLLEARRSAQTAGRPKPRCSAPSDVAIIGMATIVPGSAELDAFWDNLLQQRNFITEIPRDRFDWRLLYDGDPTARDKIVSKWGGFIADVPFDPLAFGIPPNSLKSISPIQLIVLEGVRRVLRDAGLDRVGFDRENTEVVVANGRGGGLYEELLGMRAVWPLVAPAFGPDVDSRLPQWTSESFPGCINSIAAGRVANRFDFGGLNFTVDAACAASLTAIELAVNSLEAGRANLVIAGGVDLGNTPYGYLAFSKTQALSPDGVARTFDRKANGIVLSEGIAFFALKRRRDAERDGDRIYGLIRGIGGSSDGRELGLTAPRAKGQRRALERAYVRAGFGAETIGLYEAHGTGTALGDRTEVETVVDYLRTAGARPARCVIGSHKTLIGHTKTAAGGVGVAKALLALAHRTLPPHAGADEPLEPIVEAESPVALLSAPCPWFAESTPRRCGVSAFGFGGVNLHVVLEEYMGGPHAEPPGARIWPAELLLFRAADPAALAADLSAALKELDDAPSLADFAARRHAVWRRRDPGGAALAIVVADTSSAKQKLAQARDGLASGGKPPIDALYQAPGAAFAGGKVALLFPGQGSQYVGMLREPAVYLEDIRHALESGNAVLADSMRGRLTDVIYPPRAFGAGRTEQQSSALRAPSRAQPALAALAAGLVHVLKRSGLDFDMAAGHSFGEWCALHAAGVIDETTLLRFAGTRGRLTESVSSDGAMAALAGSADAVASLLSGSDDVAIANYNSPRQTVVSGRREAVERVVARARQQGISGQLLAVGGAFHSAGMQPIAAELRDVIGRLPLQPPCRSVYSNETAAMHREDPAVLAESLGTHLTSPVRFMAMVAAMYADGARTFVEVGPQRFLSRLVTQCLDGRPHRCVSLDDGTGTIRPLLEGLGTLANSGALADLSFLWRGRTQLRRPEGSPSSLRSPRIQSWFSGSRVWTAAEPNYGKQPLLDADSSARLAIESKPQPDNPSTHLTDTSTATMIPDRVTAYTAYQETMRQFLQTQEQVMSTLLGQSLPAPSAGLPPSIPASSPPMPAAPAIPPASLPATAAPAAQTQVATPVATAESSIPSRDEVTRLLVETMSANTGYPSDMLGLDRAIEGDLGIDSIKRTEIIHAFTHRLPSAVHAPLEQQMDVLMRTKTMGEVVDLVEVALCRLRGANAGGAPTAPVVPPDIRASGMSTVTAAQCPRFICRSFPAPAVEATAGAVTGLIVLTKDSDGLAEALAQKLVAAGAATALIDVRGPASPVEAVAEARNVHGRVTGIIHLATVGRRDFPTDLVEWRRRNDVGAKALFAVVSACLPDLRLAGGNGPHVFVATSMDGRLNMSGSGGAGDFTGGACAGFLRTLRKEEPAITTKFVDVDPALDRDQTLSLLWHEFSGRDLTPEIGFPSGSRTRFAIVRQDLPAAASIPADRLPSNAVILATGGANGITAEILRRVAMPGMRCILVGRSPDGPEPAELAGLTTSHELRVHLLEQANREGKSVSPAEIEQAIAKILRGRERRATLASLRAKGAAVEYVAADVRDETVVASLVQGIYTHYGRIDAVFHGAGIIADKLIADKTAPVFAEVFDTKADSAFLLGRYLKAESLRLLVFFASTAGRFGNRGQSDYSAANELLNRMAWHLRRQWPHCRVIAINWGPWTGAGMASAAVNRKMVDDGIVPITLEAGCDFVLREIAGGQSDDVEVVAGDGPWARDADRRVE